MKKFLFIGSLSIGLAVMTTLIVWFLLQNYFISPQFSPIPNVTAPVANEEGAESNSAIGEPVGSETVSLPELESESGVEVELTESQKNLAKAFGYDSDTLNITQSMIVCAEGKLGAERVAEISAGVNPSFLEAASLVGCLNAE